MKDENSGLSEGASVSDNELIATFMGLPLTKEVPRYSSGHYEPIIKPFMRWQYHTSWDWLMPVVEKIQAIEITPPPNYQGYRIEIVVQGYVKISGFPMLAIMTNVANEGGLIQAVYKAVVQFIKFYNNQPKP